MRSSLSSVKGGLTTTMPLPSRLGSGDAGLISKVDVEDFGNAGLLPVPAGRR